MAAYGTSGQSQPLSTRIFNVTPLRTRIALLSLGGPHQRKDPQTELPANMVRGHGSQEEPTRCITISRTFLSLHSCVIACACPRTLFTAMMRSSFSTLLSGLALFQSSTGEDPRSRETTTGSSISFGSEDCVFLVNMSCWLFATSSAALQQAAKLFPMARLCAGPSASLCFEGSQQRAIMRGQT